MTLSHRARRPFAFSALLMAGLILLSTFAAAGSVALAVGTRVLFVGSGADGVISLTQPVSTGGVALADVVVRNDGKQTLTKVMLHVGAAPAAPLPAGTSIVGVSGSGAGSCVLAGDATSLLCDFGNFAKGASRTLTLLFGFAQELSGALVQVVGTVNESVNDQGGNVDTFPADGIVDVSATTCDNVATFIPPGQAKVVGTGFEGCDGQSTSLAIPAGANGHVARAAEEASSACAFDLTCFGQASVAQVDGGAGIDPYLEWTIRWPAASVGKISLNKAGVIHFRDDGSQVALFNSRKALCNANQVDCIVSFAFTADGLWLVAVFRTPTNGVVRGFG